MTPPDAISILLRTFNSHKTLGKVISRLDLRPGDEVLVVDSGSTDATLDIAREYGATILRAEGKFNYSKSLNVGFRAAKTPWVLVLSSHSIPFTGKLLEAYRSGIAQAPEEVVVIYGPNGITTRVAPQLASEGFSLYATEQAGQSAGAAGGNGNALYRLSAWEMLPFDETIRTGEDQFWRRQILAKGKRYAFQPDAITLNQNSGSLSYMFRKGRSDARAHRSPDHQPISFRHFLGAIKNHTLPFLRGEMNWRNYTRYFAHIVGQFFGSRLSEDNQPD